MKKDKVFLMYLKTGGGHIAPARSIAKYIETNFSNTETVLIDGLKDSLFYARFIVEDGYRILQNKIKWYYEFLYAVNKLPEIARGNAWLVSMHMKKYLKRRILNENPDKIVLFHFFLIMPVYEILEEAGLNIPVITVVTDPYTAHPLWFLRKEQNYILFSERLSNHARQKGITPEKIFKAPFVLDEKYSSPLAKSEVLTLKNRYGFDLNKKVILIVGGGDGIPKGKSILKELFRKPIDAEVAIICGKNKSLYNYAEKLKLRNNYNNLKVYAYVNFVYDLLNISDVVITKCGASTFMEILLMKKIPIVNDYLWEQEKGNVEFLVENSLGIYENNINRLSSIVNDLLSNETLYQSYIKRINDIKLMNGTPTVAEYIVQFGK